MLKSRMFAIIVILLFILSLSTVFVPASTWGDAGNFVSHDKKTTTSKPSSGTSSSKSSSSSTSTRKNNSDSSSTGSGQDDKDREGVSSSTYGDGGSSNTSNSSQPIGPVGTPAKTGPQSKTGWVVFLLILLVLGALITVGVFKIWFKLLSLFQRSKGHSSQELAESYASTETVTTTVYQEADLALLKERDPNFSEQALIEKVNNMFLQLQESWTRKDWKPIRAFETDALFNQHAKQLQRYIDSKTTNVVDDIGILNTKTVGYEEDGEYEVLKVLLNTRLKDYVVDNKNGEVIEGDPKQEIFMDYIWRLIRKKGILTKVTEGITSSQCPNCGANVSINATGQCDYCGSVVSSGEHDWVLSSIELVGQH